MAEYTISIARAASKQLEALPASIVERIVPKIDALAFEPRPHGVKKLRGELALWRIRIGDYRVIYAIDDASRIVDVTAIRHRSQAYD